MGPLSGGGCKKQMKTSKRWLRTEKLCHNGGLRCRQSGFRKLTKVAAKKLLERSQGSKKFSKT